jgi:hypothetical protein
VNDFQRWLSPSVGDYPSPGVVGTLSDWFELGAISVVGPTIDVADRWQNFGLTLPIEGGDYRVGARGIDYGGHRRTAAVRLLRRPGGRRGRIMGEVDVDSWGLSIGEIESWQAGIEPTEIEAFGRSLFGTYVDGCELVTWSLAGRSTSAVVAFTGLGSGGYPVFEWADDGGPVGFECEFLSADYVPESR